MNPSLNVVLLQVHHRSETLQRAPRQAGETHRQDSQEPEPALLQFYCEHVPTGQLVTVMAATKKLGIGRQTVHTGMTDGTLRWIYDAERDTIWLDSDEVYWARRQRERDEEDEEDEI